MRHQRAVLAPHRQLDHVRGVGVLPVHRGIGRPVGQHRYAHAHVQLQRRQAGLLGVVDGSGGRARHHQARAAAAVAEHGVAAAHGDMPLLDPGGIQRAHHEVPRAVRTGVRDDHRRAGEQCAFLEAVDVGVVRAVEHALAGGERPQVRAVHHQTVTCRGLFGHGIDRRVGRDRRQAVRRDLAALVVVQGAGGRGRQRIQPCTHIGARQRRGQGFQVVDVAVLGASSRTRCGWASLPIQ